MKRSSQPLRINRLLGNSSATRLLARARALSALDARLHKFIPPPLNEHCRVLSVRDATLVLAADSPVWAARLRFQSIQLIKQLTESGTVNLRTVEVRIRPPADQGVAHKSQRRKAFTRETGHILGQAARDLSDPDLRAALLRLASRCNRAGQS